MHRLWVTAAIVTTLAVSACGGTGASSQAVMAPLGCGSQPRIGGGHLMLGVNTSVDRIATSVQLDIALGGSRSYAVNPAPQSETTYAPLTIELLSGTTYDQASEIADTVNQIPGAHNASPDLSGLPFSTQTTADAVSMGLGSPYDAIAVLHDLAGNSHVAKNTTIDAYVSQNLLTTPLDATLQPSKFRHPLVATSGSAEPSSDGSRGSFDLTFSDPYTSQTRHVAGSWGCHAAIKSTVAGPNLGTPAATTTFDDSFKFSPASVTVKVGGIVAFDNHSSTVDKLQFLGSDRGLDNPEFEGGTVWMVEFEQTGTYQFIDTLHPNDMVTVVVTT